MDLNRIRNNKHFNTIMGIIVFFLVVFVIYKIYKYLANKAKERPFLVKGSKDASVPLVLPGDKLLKSTIGREFTFSFWIYVKDWGYNFNQPKHIFHIGDKDANSVAPGVWLYPKNNNLMVRMDTYNRPNNKSKTKSGLTCQNWTSKFPHKNTKYTEKNFPKAELGNHNFCRNPEGIPSGAWCYTNDPAVEKEACGFKDHTIPPTMNPRLNSDLLNEQKDCDLVNIPVQRWVHIAVVLVNKTIDVYLNGKLSRSCTLSQIPKFNDGDIYINQDGGFRGKLSDLLYVNKAMGTTEIYNTYLAGNNRFTIYDKLADMTPKVNFKMDVQVGVGNEGGVPVSESK